MLCFIPICFNSFLAFNGKIGKCRDLLGKTCVTAIKIKEKLRFFGIVYRHFGDFIRITTEKYIL
jgi:hypothetical protein